MEEVYRSVLTAGTVISYVLWLRIKEMKMDTIAVVGVTGYAGSHITAEALRRGHEVIGICRSTPPDPQTGLSVRSGTITDQALMREVCEQASTLVVAVHGAIDDAPFLPQLVPSLLEAAGAFGTRVGFVGGAGSLLVTPDGPRLIDTPDFPAMFKIEAESHADVLEALRVSDSGTDWFYVSPAAGFGSYAPGKRTANYRTGGDVLLTDEDGNSEISGADFAIAFVDEIDQPTHRRERFGVAY
jgi:putative NADH-flavin reductase